MIKKQYSFRLKNTDEDLSNFIQDLSCKFKSESEAIRQMLLYAQKHLLAEGEQNKQITQIQQDLKFLIEQQEKHNADILKSIEKASVKASDTTKDDQDNKGKEDNTIAQDTAEALLGGFGFNFE